MSPNLDTASACVLTNDNDTMVRVLAVFAVDWSREQTFGLLEKSTGLVDAARRQGFEVEALFADDQTIIVYDREVTQLPRPRGRRAAAFRYLGFWRKLEPWLEKNWDYVWVRGAHEPSVTQLRFLAKAEQSGAKVLLDLPTYPSDSEGGKTWRAWLRLLAPGYASVASHIHRVVTLSPDLEIYGRPTIQVSNGVAPGPLSERLPNHGDYLLVGLGQWADWHGLDRIFRAIAASPTPHRYRLKLAGEGPAVASSRALAAELGLRVDWLPPQYGAAREALFAAADVGIGCLAIHRKGVYPDQALKHRQYAAAGLPFIATESDPAWQGLASVWRLPSDESIPAGIRLDTFVQSARACQSEWAAELRGAAAAMTWDQTYTALWAYLQLRDGA